MTQWKDHKIEPPENTPILCKTNTGIYFVGVYKKMFFGTDANINNSIVVEWCEIPKPPTETKPKRSLINSFIKLIK